MTPNVGPELEPLVDAASAIHSALPPVPAGLRFEVRLATRLSSSSSVPPLLTALAERTRRELRHHARFIITGAVSSIALGVGVGMLAHRRGTLRRADAPGSSPRTRGA